MLPLLTLCFAAVFCSADCFFAAKNANEISKRVLKPYSRSLSVYHLPLGEIVNRHAWFAQENGKTMVMFIEEACYFFC